MEFFVDPSRCIGCNACVLACSECDTHKGQSMIQLDYVDRAVSTQTAPMICMHCNSPTCAEVCPADAIKRTADGVVNLMMKCDMCYDRTSVGGKPMCASVCPSQALFYGTREELARLRPNSRAINSFQFGRQTIETKVNMMVPKNAPVMRVDVTSAMDQPPIGQATEEDDLLINLFVA